MCKRRSSRIKMFLIWLLAYLMHLFLKCLQQWRYIQNWQIVLCMKFGGESRHMSTPPYCSGNTHSKGSKRVCYNSCIPLPFVFVEENNDKNPTCLWVENCPFCGLALQPLWGGIIASYKHVYHG